MWDMDLVVVVFVALAGKVDELQDKWPTCDDATASREKVSANNVLKHRRLSRRLRSYYNLYKSVFVPAQRIKALIKVAQLFTKLLARIGNVQFGASPGNHFQWC